MTSGAFAQSGPRPPPPRPAADAGDEEASAGEVVVNAQRAPVGSVVGEVKPEISLTPADIQSYGVSSVADLLDELTPQTRSDRGRGGETPVVLLNGRRISGFYEIRDIPVEAIQRVDVLPEEVGLKYGYDANQKVVNIVLRRRFRAITGEGVAGGATEGGLVNGQAEADLLHLRNNDRLNLDLKLQAASGLTEHDRGVTPLVAAAPGVVARLDDDTRQRSLSPQTRQIGFNGVMSRSVLGGWSATLNGTLGASHSLSRQGWAEVSLTTPPADPFAQSSVPETVLRDAPAAGALRQTVDGWTAHLGAAVDRDIHQWRVNFTTAYDHADSLTVTQTGLDASAWQARLDALDPSFDPFAPLPAGELVRTPDAKARSRTDSANAQALANGPIAQLPAGPLFVSLKLGDTVSALEARSLRSGAVQAQSFNRNDVNAQLNLDLPLASRRRGVLKRLGDLTLNGNIAADRLSDFGTLATYGFGVVWSPLPGLTVIASNTEDQSAPSQQQLGAPVVSSANQHVYDYATGRTVSVVKLTGGDPALVSDLRDVWKLGLTWKAPIEQDLTFSANYVSSRIKNPIMSFPAVTAELEAAFPSHFQRDGSGRLIAIDERPVNFADQRRAELRWGVDFSMPVGPAPPPRAFSRGERDSAGPRPDGGGGGRGRGSGGGGFGPPRGGRLQLALYHTVYFTDELLAARGGPRLDLLNGAPAGGTGGQPQHELEAQFGYMKDGLGLRLSADWKSATTVKGAPGATAGDLSFSDLATMNLRLFANLSALPEAAKAWPFLRGARLSLAAANLFDARQHVHDATGATPAGYQSALLDPAGRTVRISFRKLFF